MALHGGPHSPLCGSSPPKSLVFQISACRFCRSECVDADPLGVLDDVQPRVVCSSWGLVCRTEDYADHYCRRAMCGKDYPMIPSFFSVAVSSATFSFSMPTSGRRSSSVQWLARAMAVLIGMGLVASLRKAAKSG
jgi:hypothetical protein